MAREVLGLLAFVAGVAAVWWLAAIVLPVAASLADLWRDRRRASEERFLAPPAEAALAPWHEVRAARRAFEDSPTAEHRVQLAAALLAVGESELAAFEYAQCLRGPAGQLPEVRLGAARALVECQRHTEALALLQPLRVAFPGHEPEAAMLLTARAFAGLGCATAARAEFQAAVNRFQSWESQAEYAIWAYSIGDFATASRLQQDLELVIERWNGPTREGHRPDERRLRAASVLARLQA